jgi:DNA-binding NarL/FixJ family response regulator
MPPITVLLADDTDAIRAAISRILAPDPGIQVIGEAANFTEAIRMAAELKPDVVVVDLHMPDENTFDPSFIKSQLLLSAKHLLVVSIWIDEESKALANRYGAARFLEKSNLGTELIPAILELG